MGHLRQIQDQQLDIQRQLAAQSYAPQTQAAPRLPGPPEMSEADRGRLHKLQWDMDELRDTSFGTPGERSAKRKELNREMEMIYARYGARVSDETAVVVNNPSPPPVPISQGPVTFRETPNGRGFWGSDGSFVPKAPSPMDPFRNR